MRVQVWCVALAALPLAACGGSGGAIVGTIVGTSTGTAAVAVVPSAPTTPTANPTITPASPANPSSAGTSANAAVRSPLFNPTGQKKLLIVGQDMVALGGIADGRTTYADGFLNDRDLKSLPVGVTTYLQINDTQGLTTTFHNLGEEKNAQLVVDHAEFVGTKPLLFIGYFLDNDYDAVLSGRRDAVLKTQADWISARNVPTFLRIGYEFNAGWTGHAGNQAQFIAVYRYIVDKFSQWGVKNCAYVWQTDGYGTASELAAFYPGDAYVDWMGYSHFNTGSGNGIFELADQRNKPIMIAEAAPVGFKLSSAGDSDGQRAWDDWYAPLFTHINSHPRIRALAYINDNWPAKPMWASNNFFKNTDSRIQKSAIVKRKFIDEISAGGWLGRSDVLSAIGWPPKP